jgi:hypothetical protein
MNSVFIFSILSLVFEFNITLIMQNFERLSRVFFEKNDENRYFASVKDNMNDIDALLIRYFAKDVIDSLVFGECVMVRRKSYAISWAVERVARLTLDEKKDLYNKITKGKK